MYTYVGATHWATFAHFRPAVHRCFMRLLCVRSQTCSAKKPTTTVRTHAPCTMLQPQPLCLLIHGTPSVFCFRDLREKFSSSFYDFNASSQVELSGAKCKLCVMCARDRGWFWWHHRAQSDHNILGHPPEAADASLCGHQLRSCIHIHMRTFQAW